MGPGKIGTPVILVLGSQGLDLDFNKAVRTKHGTLGRSMLLPFLKSRIDTNINGPQNHGLLGLPPCSPSTPGESGTWVSIARADGSLFAIASASINKRGPGREEVQPSQVGPGNIIQRLRELLTWHSDISHPQTSLIDQSIRN